MNFFDFINKFHYFTGVPDSLLSPLVDYLMSKYGVSKEHTICANESNAVGMAIGYHLATRRIPVVYLQNSGIGNIINPITSLLREEVLGIPCFFLVGWRGQPNMARDEPQHLYQGKKTIAQLEDAGVICFTLKENALSTWTENQFREILLLLKQGKQVALLIQKNALTFPVCETDPLPSPVYQNHFSWRREEILALLLDQLELSHLQKTKHIFIATTGKTSRELFALRQSRGQSHEMDFLTVGGMGQASSIALAIALEKPDCLVWCLDGDGACLMHLGAMAVLGAKKPPNLIHVLLNNQSHESVGGAPTVSDTCDWLLLAQGFHYPFAFAPQTKEELSACIQRFHVSHGLTFLQVNIALGSREDLGRPHKSPQEYKKQFMYYLDQKNPWEEGTEGTAFNEAT